MKILQWRNEYSTVWHDGRWVYKRQHEFLTDNEIHFLSLLHHTGYVPFAEQVERDVIRLDYIRPQNVIDKEGFLGHVGLVLAALQDHKIRHGDLTKQAILVRHDKPVLIDFAESRFWRDPRPDKRPEGDDYWLPKSMKELAYEGR